MRVVEEPVEDGVAEGGIADDILPVFDGDLAGEQGATAGVAVVEDLEEVVPALARERSEPPVVEDEEPRPGEPLDELGIRPVAAGEGEFVEEAGDAVVARRDAEAAGLVAERTGEIGFSHPVAPVMQRHAFVALKLPVDLYPVRLRSGNPRRGGGAGNTAASSAASSSPSGNGRHRAVGDAERRGDLAVAAPELVLQAQMLSNLPHGQPSL